MFSDAKPYSSYRTSGVEWLGEVPAHWEVAMLKRHYTIQLGKMLQNKPNKSDDVEIPYLKAQHVQWFQVRTKDAPKMWASQNDIGQFGVALGDLLVCEGGEGGRCGILKQEGDGYIIQNALHRVRPREQNRNEFLQYVMSSVAAAGWFDALNDKATIAHFTREKFGALRIPLPPLAEQTAIVHFLDHADRRIRRYIRAKQKLIALLEEQKQAIIHEAVTYGLDSNVRLKPSGVEGLGDVPAHWEVVALGYLATKFGSGVTPRGGATVYQETGIPFLRSQNIHFDGLHLGGVARITPRLHQSLSNTHVKPGDVLLNITGASIGRVCSVPDHFSEGNVSQHVCIIRPKKNRLLSGFLASFLSTAFMQREIRFEQNGASREGLTLHSIRNFKIVLPSISEQQYILAEIRAHTERLAAAITATRSQIALLQEYRTRLIADVVTGKLDVREAAAELPDVDTSEGEDTSEADFDELDATPQEANV